MNFRNFVIQHCNIHLLQFRKFFLMLELNRKLYEYFMSKRSSLQYYVFLKLKRYNTYINTKCNYCNIYLFPSLTTVCKLQINAQYSMVLNFNIRCILIDTIVIKFTTQCISCFLKKNHNKTNPLDFGILLLNKEILTINYKLPASELLLTPLTFQQV